VEYHGLLYEKGVAVVTGYNYDYIFGIIENVTKFEGDLFLI